MCKRKIIWTLMLLLGFTGSLRAQSQEAQQLLLNVAKLDALNGILKNMEDGWRLVSSGYRTVKNVSEGNFSIHRIFLDNLTQVSPAVRNYRKIAGIVSNQLTIVREYKKAYNRFRDAGTFDADEIGYLGRVYDKLLAKSMKNLDALAMVVTAGQLRMSDEERLELIDSIYGDTEDQLLFLRDFNGKTAVLSMQRHREKSDISAVKGLHGITDWYNGLKTKR